MRHTILLIALLLAPAAAFAQGPLVVERVHDPFVVAPDYKVTDFDGDTGQLAGFYAGRSIEQALFVGGAGYWLVNGSDGDKLWYGGVVTGWSMPAGSRLRLGARGLVGIGSATLGTPFTIRRGDVRFGRNDRPEVQTATLRVLRRDDFFVFEPQAEAVARLTDHVGVRVGGGYRLAALDDALDGRLDGVMGSVGVQLEW